MKNKIQEYLINGKLDLDKLLFHSLFFWKEIEGYDLKILESILKSGEIATRDRLEEILKENELRLLLSLKNDRFNWNGNNRVSIVRKNGAEARNVISSDKAFYLFCLDHISIIIDPCIIFKKRRYSPGIGPADVPLMYGEYQIRDSIEKDYFLGISMPSYVSESIIIEIMKRDNFINYKLIDDLINLSDNDFFTKYFSKQLAIENLLQENNYDLDIYDINTGSKLRASEEEMNKLLTYKRKIINKSLK